MEADSGAMRARCKSEEEEGRREGAGKGRRRERADDKRDIMEEKRRTGMRILNVSIIEHQKEKIKWPKTARWKRESDGDEG